MKRKWIFIIPAAIAGMLLFVFIGGTIVQLLWNWLLPPLFGWHELTFWQALGMLVLCRILFGGSGWKGSGRSRATPEQRERFRQAVRKRFGFDPSSGENPAPTGERFS